MDDRAVVGIDFGGTKVDIAVEGASGGFERRERLETRAADGAAVAVRRALARAAGLAAESGVVPGGLGITVPGSVREGRVELASNIPGLETVDLVAEVERYFPGVPLRLVNDLNAAADVEVASGALQGVGTAMIVGLGTGVAAGVVIDGRLRTGAHGAAGEIGFTPMITPDGLGGLGGRRRATIEEIAGGAAFDRLAVEAGLVDSRALFEHVADDEELRRVLLGRLALLADVLAACGNLVDPERIVFFGGMSAAALVRSTVSEQLSEALAMPVELCWLDTERNASLRGALHHARLLPVGGQVGA